MSARVTGMLYMLRGETDQPLKNQIEDENFVMGGTNGSQSPKKV